MSNCIDVASEQVCYIPCNFCNIVLAVSVPCSSLFDIVTVRCGHCTNLWSVNMAAALQSLSWQDLQTTNSTSPDERTNLGSSSKCTNKMTTATRSPTTKNEERIVNRRELLFNSTRGQFFCIFVFFFMQISVIAAPEKKQRVPSAYNQFIKQEIQRIKANNPDISHREAFSAAAKNWAHFPHIHFGLTLETINQAKVDEVAEKHLMN